MDTLYESPEQLLFRHSGASRNPEDSKHWTPAFAGVTKFVMNHFWMVLGLVAATSASAAPGLFSLTGLDGWDAQTFRKKTPTQYALVKDSGTQVLRADCKASASGFISRGEIDLAKTPVLEWRWKVDQVYPGLNEREKSGDDFPARVYVVRDGGWAVWRTRSLVYAWASHEPAGNDWPNPYTGQAHMVALQSGAAKAGRWITEKRDLRADFKRYFDLDLDTLDGIALMSDCDDAGGETRAWFGDIQTR